MGVDMKGMEKILKIQILDDCLEQSKKLKELANKRGRDDISDLMSKDIKLTEDAIWDILNEVSQ